MKLEIGLNETEEVNTRYGPLAVLLSEFGRHGVLDELETLGIGMKRVRYSPGGKVKQVLVSILSGCETLSEVNVRLRPEAVLAQVGGIGSFAHQSTLSATLDRLSRGNLSELEYETLKISRRISRTVRHDWRGHLGLDFDMTGLPCGKQAEGGAKGYLSGKKIGFCAR